MILGLAGTGFTLGVVSIELKEKLNRTPKAMKYLMILTFI